jgi:hypothetical protein
MQSARLRSDKTRDNQALNVWQICEQQLRRFLDTHPPRPLPQDRLNDVDTIIRKISGFVKGKRNLVKAIFGKRVQEGWTR